MRYPDGGGLIAEQRKRREEVRMRAVDLFEEGVEVPRIVCELRVSGKSVHQWRLTWRAGGREALRSRGPSGYGCRLGTHLRRSSSRCGWRRGRPRTAGRTTRCGPQQGYAR
ncbi:helix-turn-helix domain-containing protein [Streptomyces solisilvae]|uniref:helix-turn-helix domain-containing protein n=1 Tax=Streptomyces malaysiensis TaxID=92644 RepID=UPI00371441CE